MDGHIDGLAVHGQVLLVGSGVAPGDRLVGHTATLVAGRLAGRQRTGLARGAVDLGGGSRRQPLAGSSEPPADGHQSVPDEGCSTVE
jgi:hypothetical protein